MFLVHFHGDNEYYYRLKPYWLSIKDNNKSSLFDFLKKA